MVVDQQEDDNGDILPVPQKLRCEVIYRQYLSQFHKWLVTTEKHAAVDARDSSCITHELAVKFILNNLAKRRSLSHSHMENVVKAMNFYRRLNSPGGIVLFCYCINEECNVCRAWQ